MSGLSLERVEGAAALDRFVRLPERLMAGDPNWVPPLRLERRRALQARHNPLFRHAAAARWIARRDGRDVGRISAQDDEAAPPGPGGDRPGHWGWLAADPGDAEALRALLGAAGDWLRGRGRRRMLGPFSSSINEEAGLLVRGFGSPPMLMMPHDPPGLGDAVEALGHRPAMDLHAFLFDPRLPLPRGPRALVARGLPTGVRLRRLRMADYRAEVGRMVEIFNDAWAGNWGSRR